MNTSDVAPAVVEQNARTNEALRKLAIAVAVLFLLLNATTAISVIWVAVDGRNAAETNTRILDVIVAVTGCTVEDTAEQCTERFRAAGIREGTRRIIEVDCTHRRAHAGLPAPDPTRFCTEQTPVEVYPGPPE